jgi:uncharacterized protein with HEPN domain
MKRDYRDYLDDIVNAIEEVEAFTAGMSFEDFSKDKKTINAVVRSFEIIGEAAKVIPANIKKKHADVPWKKMAGMRDKLIHEYFGVDLEIIWVVIKDELPPIKPLIKKIVNGI